MEDNFNRLFDVIKTDYDMSLSLNFLDDLAENIFKTDDSLSRFIQKSSNNPLFAAILAILPSDLQNGDGDKNEIKNLTTEIKKRIQALKKLSLTLAIKPNEKILKTVKDWARTNTGEQVVLDVTVDPEIIGGAIIVRNGTYHDYSIAKKIKDIFVEKHDALMAKILA